jgi:hypothetical protein
MDALEQRSQGSTFFFSPQFHSLVRHQRVEYSAIYDGYLFTRYITSSWRFFVLDLLTLCAASGAFSSFVSKLVFLHIITY